MTDTLDDLRRILSRYVPTDGDTARHGGTDQPRTRPVPDDAERQLVETHIDDLLDHDDTRAMLGWWVWTFLPHEGRRIVGDAGARRRLLTGPLVDQRITDIPEPPVRLRLWRVLDIDVLTELAAAVRKRTGTDDYSTAQARRIVDAALTDRGETVAEAFADQFAVAPESALVSDLSALLDECFRMADMTKRLWPVSSITEERWLAPGDDPGHEDLGEFLDPHDISWLSPYLVPGIFDWVVAARRLVTWVNVPVPGTVPGADWAYSNTEERESSVADLCGRERMLVTHWRSPMFPAALRPRMVAFARQMIEAGLWGGDRVKLTVRIPEEHSGEFPEDRLGWHDVGVPVFSLHGSHFYPDGYPDGTTEILVRREDIPRLNADIVTGPPDPGLHLTAGEMTDQLDLIEQLPGDPDGTPGIDGTLVRQIHEVTGLSTPAARMLCGGVHRNLSFAELKKYRLTLTESELAWEQFSRLRFETLSRLVVAAAEGISAVREVWAAEGPFPFSLTDREWEMLHTADRKDDGDRVDLVCSLLYSDRLGRPDLVLSPLLTLASVFPLSDPRRPALDAQLRRVRAACVDWVQDPSHAHFLGTMDLGGPVDDPGFVDTVRPGNQVSRVPAEGLIDDLIADLDTVHPDLPGCPLDPLNSVPDLVAEAAATLHLSENAAAYYLQLLALIDPSDGNIREWNGWTQSTIDVAAAELFGADLAVPDARGGTGRTCFLPGGWLPEGEGRPTEVWTAPLYLMWQDAISTPVVPGCPPHVPVRDLFRATWQRILDGDTPGYETLTTTRHPARK